jgi:hypothetical protein
MTSSASWFKDGLVLEHRSCSELARLVLAHETKHADQWAIFGNPAHTPAAFWRRSPRPVSHSGPIMRPGDSLM